ncbi:uncharacterized protein LOC134036991 [Osmerus eperlanus]|uniref:uncharacterized protein LOC134036991 n=1 Tax=Osmerus eperlanus TaxID=29151 RepID=UPI002E14183D
METTSGFGGLAWNFTSVSSTPGRPSQASVGQAEGEEPYFVDYVPPARDAIVLPRHVVYILVAVILVVMAMYAIVGHLIKDLMHDFTDWILGPKPEALDTERGQEGEEEQRSVYDDQMRAEKWRQETEEEREGLLPGYCHLPADPPLRSAISAFPSNKGPSNQNVTFSFSLTPYITSV